MSTLTFHMPRKTPPCHISDFQILSLLSLIHASKPLIWRQRPTVKTIENHFSSNNSGNMGQDYHWLQKHQHYDRLLHQHITWLPEPVLCLLWPPQKGGPPQLFCSSREGRHPHATEAASGKWVFWPTALQCGSVAEQQRTQRTPERVVKAAQWVISLSGTT